MLSSLLQEGGSHMDRIRFYPVFLFIPLLNLPYRTKCLNIVFHWTILGRNWGHWIEIAQELVGWFFVDGLHFPLFLVSMQKAHEGRVFFFRNVCHFSSFIGGVHLEKWDSKSWYFFQFNITREPYPLRDT